MSATSAKLLFVESPFGGSPQESTRVWTGWTPMAQGFRAKSPRVHRYPPPEKTPLFRGRGLNCRCPRDFRPRSDSRRSTIIIMRATLHDLTSNTYYGQWPGGKAAVSGLRTPAIAHNKLVESARFVTFDVPERDFPENRSPARRRFVST